MLLFLSSVDCIHTTELANIGRGMPMVDNPIYEGGAIYEEIPGDPSYLKSLPSPTPMEREEGYVSISTSNRDTLTLEKLNAVKNVQSHSTIIIQSQPKFLNGGGLVLIGTYTI